MWQVSKSVDPDQTRRLVWVYTFCKHPKVPFRMMLAKCLSQDSHRRIHQGNLSRRMTQQWRHCGRLQSRWSGSWTSWLHTPACSCPSSLRKTHWNIVGTFKSRFTFTLKQLPGQQIRSKIDSFQNANFLISQSNPMVWPLNGIVSERRFQWGSHHRVLLRNEKVSMKTFLVTLS